MSTEGEPPDDAPEIFRVRRKVLAAADAKGELLALADALAKALVRVSGEEPEGRVRYRGPGAPRGET